MEDQRPRITVILDPDVKDAVERQAQSERSTLSGICRRVISDWAASRQARQVAAGVLLALLLLLPIGARAQTIDCTGPAGGNCIPTVQIAAPSRITIGSGIAGYPAGATPVQNSATGTTAGATATLPAAAGQFTYLCGFSVSPGSATTAIVITITTTGLASNQSLSAGAPATAAGATGAMVSPPIGPFCLKSNLVNTAITVVASALGTGGAGQAVNAWGFTQ